MLGARRLGVPGREDLARPLAQLWLRIPPHRAGAMAFNYPHDIAPRVDGFWLFDPAELKTRIEPVFSAAMPVTGAGRINAECSPYPSGALPDVFIEGRPFDAAQARSSRRWRGRWPPLGGRCSWKRRPSAARNSAAPWNSRNACWIRPAPCSPPSTSTGTWVTAS
jgi:hypothetical protein